MLFLNSDFVRVPAAYDPPEGFGEVLFLVHARP